MAQIELIDNPMFDDANLLVNWRFEDNFNDSKNSYNEGWHGTGTSFIAGVYGKGVHLNGTAGEGYVTFGHVDDLNLVTSDFSIGMWIRVDNPANWCIPFSYGEANVDGYYLQRLGSGSSYAFYNSWSGGNEYVTIPFGIASGEWMHIVVTRDGNTIKGYSNGEPVTVTGAWSRNPAEQGSGRFWVLGGYYNATYTTHADYDDLFIFSKALSDEEVAMIYDYNAGFSGPFPTHRNP